LVWLLYGGRLTAPEIEAGIRELGLFAPLVFVATFALATVFFVPGSLFGLAGGMLFGPLWGTAWNLTGGTIGAVLAFLAARFGAGDWIAANAAGRLKTILAGVEAEGWRFVALARLVPIVPFTLLNYLLGLTRIPFSHYVVTTLACMVPGALAYAWLGHAGRAVMAGENDALRYGTLGLAMLAIVAFVGHLTRRRRQKSQKFISPQELRGSLAADQSAIVLDVREPSEFVGPLGHIQGAINIPLDRLATAWNDVGAWPHPIVVVCRTDKRSAQAADILHARGVGNVRVLLGGMEAWNKENASRIAVNT